HPAAVSASVRLAPSRAPVTLPTLATDAVELEAVARDHGTELLGDALVERGDLEARELHDPRAALADEVVVGALSTVCFLEPRFAIVEVAFGRQAALLQQAERAIDGGVADPRVDLFHLGVELFDADVAVGGRKH